MGSRWGEASVQGPSQWAFKLGSDKRALPTSYLRADNTHLSCSFPSTGPGLPSGGLPAGAAGYKRQRGDGWVAAVWRLGMEPGQAAISLLLFGGRNVSDCGMATAR